MMVEMLWAMSSEFRIGFASGKIINWLRIEEQGFYRDSDYKILGKLRIFFKALRFLYDMYKYILTHEELW